jgi:serine/threonine protein kinase
LAGFVAKLKKSISFETTFGTYVVDELLGEGGAGRVYGGTGLDGNPIALKLLAEDKATTDKRRRFKNEISFLIRNNHPNIVAVLDHGIAHGDVAGPFYVMRRYHCSLRDLMIKGIDPQKVMPLFSQILDGVEAAHLKRVIHRDLKPENVLCDKDSDIVAIADFGTARLTEDILATIIETAPTQRLANFQYAAPEQRRAGGDVQAAADIYALGLILNELFTGVIPVGTEPRRISQVSEDQAYLDDVVSKMLRQTPSDRPQSITEVKRLIQHHQSDAVSLQRLSKIDGTVIKATAIDEPLAEAPPRLVDASWDEGELTLVLDRPVSPDWVAALRNMSGYTSVLGKGPDVFSFIGKLATVRSSEHQVQAIVDNFKAWLPGATRTLKHRLEQAAQREATQEREQLKRAKETEERRLRVNRNIKI